MSKHLFSSAPSTSYELKQCHSEAIPGDSNYKYGYYCTQQQACCDFNNESEGNKNDFKEQLVQCCPSEKSVCCESKQISQQRWCCSNTDQQLICGQDYLTCQRQDGKVIDGLKLELAEKIKVPIVKLKEKINDQK
ncbi:UNKNOWN [Stylonychia lemnae]|uniref:Uncharacterized protein n=1 Tax=Stylonychia lemnae TaxID=5949 RepID=A0A078B5V6_STYLE|nr:UNKNOWN [Stylonychia lemnae]|eukprot:CDW89885.1 UNKNOWN [Stylonychia lemnae]